MHTLNPFSYTDPYFYFAHSYVIDDINEKLGLEITESDEIDTIGGFVVHQLGYIPAVNEVLSEPSVRITVLQASKRRVERVRIERVSNGSE